MMVNIQYFVVQLVVRLLLHHNQRSKINLMKGWDTDLSLFVVLLSGSIHAVQLPFIYFHCLRFADSI